MNLQKIIKKRCSTRNYVKKHVRKIDLLKILDAGIWGPSLSGLQPYFFVIVVNKKIKNMICDSLEKKLKRLGVVGRAIFVPVTLTALKSCDVLIAIYNSGRFKSMIKKFSNYVTKVEDNEYLKLAEQAEISACSAAVQNMILMAESLGLGTCWLHVPLFCNSKINKLLGMNNKLVACLTIGYSAEETKRSPRLASAEIIKLIT